MAEQHSGELHLMITDVIMPEMNGRELAGRLAAMRPEMKLLYISGYSEDLVADRGTVDQGAFLPKPFGPNQLLEKVKELLASEEPRS
jgi:two-component system, cell cycle sensor histidine kinase and response regulator CckA